MGHGFKFSSQEGGCFVVGGGGWRRLEGPTCFRERRKSIPGGCCRDILSLKLPKAGRTLHPTLSTSWSARLQRRGTQRFRASWHAVPTRPCPRAFSVSCGAGRRIFLASPFHAKPSDSYPPPKR